MSFVDLHDLRTPPPAYRTHASTPALPPLSPLPSPPPDPASYHTPLRPSRPIRLPKSSLASLSSLSSPPLSSSPASPPTSISTSCFSTPSDSHRLSSSSSAGSSFTDASSICSLASPRNSNLFSSFPLPPTPDSTLHKSPVARAEQSGGFAPNSRVYPPARRDSLAAHLDTGNASTYSRDGRVEWDVRPRPVPINIPSCHTGRTVVADTVEEADEDDRSSRESPVDPNPLVETGWSSSALAGRSSLIRDDRSPSLLPYFSCDSHDAQTLVRSPTRRGGDFDLRSDPKGVESEAERSALRARRRSGIVFPVDYGRTELWTERDVPFRLDEAACEGDAEPTDGVRSSSLRAGSLTRLDTDPPVLPRSTNSPPTPYEPTPPLVLSSWPPSCLLAPPPELSSPLPSLELRPTRTSTSTVTISTSSTIRPGRQRIWSARTNRYVWVTLVAAPSDPIPSRSLVAQSTEPECQEGALPGTSELEVHEERMRQTDGSLFPAPRLPYPSRPRL